MTSDREKIRPVIITLKSTENYSPEEHFQNKTLRPIIKMQHNLLAAYFMEYLITKKCKFKELTEQKQVEFINVVFSKDNSFKAELRGLIIGQLTVDEFTIYTLAKNDFNKRILAMIKQRLISALKLF